MVYKLKDYVKFFNSVTGSYLEREDTGERFEMQGVAVDIIQLIDGERDMDHILEELCKLFGPDVDPLMIAGDLQRFMGQLEEAGLVVMVRDTFEEGYEAFKKMRQQQQQ